MEGWLLGVGLVLIWLLFVGEMKGIATGARGAQQQPLKRLGGNKLLRRDLNNWVSLGWELPPILQ